MLHFSSYYSSLKIVDKHNETQSPQLQSHSQSQQQSKTQSQQLKLLQTLQDSPDSPDPSKQSSHSRDQFEALSPLTLLPGSTKVAASAAAANTRQDLAR